MFRQNSKYFSLLGFGGALLLWALAGCSTVSSGDCQTQGWERLATKMGQNGEALTEQDTLFRACESYGVSIDRQRFGEIYQAGLTAYCTPENAFKQGEKGRIYQKVCPSNLEPQFLVEYERGYSEFRARKKIENLQRVDGSGRDQSRASSSPAR